MKVPAFLKRFPRKPYEETSLPPHEHEWDLVLRTFVEPKPINFPDNKELEKISLTGMTTYLFQCKKCQSFHREECLGLEETDLERILAKVEVGGPEYIMKDNKTYIVMRKPDTSLPMR